MRFFPCISLLFTNTNTHCIIFITTQEITLTIISITMPFFNNHKIHKTTRKLSVHGWMCCWIFPAETQRRRADARDAKGTQRSQRSLRRDAEINTSGMSLNRFTYCFRLTRSTEATHYNKWRMKNEEWKIQVELSVFFSILASDRLIVRSTSNV